MRDAEQLVVRELDPRAGIAVVEQDLDAGGLQLAVQAFGDLADALGFLQVDRISDTVNGAIGSGQRMPRSS